MKKKWAAVKYQIFKLANSLILSIQPHVFLTGYPLTNACRIRRGNFYFDRGMTTPPKSVCKRKPSRSRPGGEARCFYRPCAADLGSKGLSMQPEVINPCIS